MQRQCNGSPDPAALTHDRPSRRWICRRRRLWRGALVAASAALIWGRAAHAIDYSNDRCRLTNASFLTNDELFWYDSKEGRVKPRCESCFPLEVTATQLCLTDCFFPYQNGTHDFDSVVDTLFRLPWEHLVQPPFANVTLANPTFIVGYGPPGSGKSHIVEWLSYLAPELQVTRDNTMDGNIDMVFQSLRQFRVEYESMSQACANCTCTTDELLGFRQRLYSVYRYFSDQVNDELLYLSTLERLNIYWETTGWATTWTLPIVEKMKRWGYRVVVVYPLAFTHQLQQRASKREKEKGQILNYPVSIARNAERATSNFLLLGASPNDTTLDVTGRRVLKGADRLLLVDNSGRKTSRRPLIFDRRCDTGISVSGEAKFECFTTCNPSFCDRLDVWLGAGGISAAEEDGGMSGIEKQMIECCTADWRARECARRLAGKVLATYSDEEIIQLRSLGRMPWDSRLARDAFRLIHVPSDQPISIPQRCVAEAHTLHANQVLHAYIIQQLKQTQQTTDLQKHVQEVIDAQEQLAFEGYAARCALMANAHMTLQETFSIVEEVLHLEKGMQFYWTKDRQLCALRRYPSPSLPPHHFSGLGPPRPPPNSRQHHHNNTTTTAALGHPQFFKSNLCVSVMPFNTPCGLPGLQDGRHKCWMIALRERVNVTASSRLGGDGHYSMDDHLERRCREALGVPSCQHWEFRETSSSSSSGSGSRQQMHTDGRQRETIRRLYLKGSNMVFSMVGGSVTSRSPEDIAREVATDRGRPSITEEVRDGVRVGRRKLSILAPEWTGADSSMDDPQSLSDSRARLLSLYSSDINECRDVWDKRRGKPTDALSDPFTAAFRGEMDRKVPRSPLHSADVSMRLAAVHEHPRLPAAIDGAGEGAWGVGMWRSLAEQLRLFA
ncbi:unnamed protein product [Vitrella brassicaformis CCMP3155]|uniref:Zeta toxin domain-containing protein n=4 Tax=Vitrella brassicaformis TaxID=1169539 RepID=A0A0G4EVK1_VITBC|nr:unnamed protein product [Vitrella brassicaformis CCMP3155]|eukprot:CEM02110.1 unnamed protein product [Vitrella brassicaformis CCMP3155]